MEISNSPVADVISVARMAPALSLMMEISSPNTKRSAGRPDGSAAVMRIDTPCVP